MRPCETLARDGQDSDHANRHSEHRLCHFGVCGALDLLKCVPISALPQQGHESCSERLFFSSQSGDHSMLNALSPTISNAYGRFLLAY